MGGAQGSGNSPAAAFLVLSTEEKRHLAVGKTGHRPSKAVPRTPCHRRPPHENEESCLASPSCTCRTTERAEYHSPDPSFRGPCWPQPACLTLAHTPETLTLK